MTKINQPLVSIITPSWNGVEFVHRLLDSILQQTYSNIEYIYVDDGSTDGTKDVVLSYQNKFEERGISFEYIWKKNGGVSSTVLEGLKHINGEFVCWPEYDDWLTPNSIERRVKYLQAHPDCAVVTSEAWLVSEANINKIIGVLSSHNKNRFDRNHFTQMLRSDTIFTAACHMCRVDKFDETHPNRDFYAGLTGPNVQILLPLYYKYNRGFIEEPLCYYMIREDSISNSNQKTIEKQCWAITEFINVFFNTLDMIEMSEEDRKIYKDIVSQKYADDRITLGYKNMNRDIFMIGYTYYQQTHKYMSPQIKKYVSIMDNNNSFRRNKMLRKIKHLLLNR